MKLIHTPREKNEMDEEDEDETGVSEYTNLIAIHAMKLKGELESLLKDSSKRVARLSMSEQRLQHAVKTSATDIVRFTQSISERNTDFVNELQSTCWMDSWSSDGCIQHAGVWKEPRHHAGNVQS